MDYDLCGSLGELETKLASDPGGAPLFGYTQPQNIHISVITRQGAKPISGEDYHSFYAPYASRIRRMDGCFGKFIATLKSRGIYDSSIVILTADHGDSLGEQGRWGHAYTIYPEIVRIPLVMHLPPAIRESMRINTKELAFSTDITPTLYYLTGHKPTNRNELFGKPLVLADSAEAGAWRHDNYLIASSYAAVYGILNRDGSKLTVADAVGYKDYEFNLGAFGSDNTSLSGSAKTSNEELIRKKVLELNKFYKFANAAAH
jgi:arylsulfatase A-like enzyme